MKRIQTIQDSARNETVIVWRKENASWLRWSRQLAVTLIGYKQDNGMKRADLASKLGVSPKYVSKLLSGTEKSEF